MKLLGCVLVDLSKDFDSIPHNFLFVKLSFYGFDKTAPKYICSYLNKKKTSVCENKQYIWWF